MSLKERQNSRYNVHSLDESFFVTESPVTPYSRWHREGPKDITFLDVDWIEYCDRCYEPLLLCEVAYGLDNTNKPYYVTRALAVAAGIPAVVLLYDTFDGTHLGHISVFKVREVAPAIGDFKALIPKEWAQHLTDLHRSHNCERAAS